MKNVGQPIPVALFYSLLISVDRMGDQGFALWNDFTWYGPIQIMRQRTPQF